MFLQLSFTLLLLYFFFGFHFSFLIILSRLILVWSIRKQYCLENLKNLFITGSFNPTLSFRFKLDGSKINWHSTFSLSIILEKLILFLVWEHNCSNSMSNFSLWSANPTHEDITWLTLSLSFKQMRQCGAPPDCSALIPDVR